MSTMLAALPRSNRPSMELHVFFLGLFLLLGVNQGFSQQTSADQAQVIQKCIDLPAMQQVYPKNADGTYEQLYVYYYHPLLFPTDLQVIQNSKRVPFKEMAKAINQVAEPFFLFKSFQLNKDAASISYDFYFTQSGLQYRFQVKVDLEKSDNSWMVTKTEIKN